MVGTEPRRPSQSEPTSAKQQPGGGDRLRRIDSLCVTYRVRLEIKKLQSFLVAVLDWDCLGSNTSNQVLCANVQVLKSTTGCEEDFLPTYLLHSCCFILFVYYATLDV